MATLEINDEESAMLRDVLESYLSTLHDEIAHTDSRDFKERLKKVETFLKDLVGRLA